MVTNGRPLLVASSREERELGLQSIDDGVAYGEPFRSGRATLRFDGDGVRLDAVTIAKQTKAKLVTTFDLGRAIVGELGFPKDRLGFDTQGNFGGAMQAAEYLVSRGHRRIAFVGYEIGAGSGSLHLRERLAGYLAALAGAGLAPSLRRAGL